MCNFTDVTFSHDTLLATQKIDRNGAAQIIVQNLGETLIHLNGNIPIKAGETFAEPVNVGEVSKTEYYIKLASGDGPALLTRKFYNCNECKK